MARQINMLSPLKVKSLSEKGLYADGGGLYLQVANRGTKSWIFRFKKRGRARDMGLGPLTTINLKEARDAAKACRRLRLDGLDPIEHRAAIHAASEFNHAKAASFGECAEKFIVAHAPGWKSPKHADQFRMTLLGVDARGKAAKYDYCKPIRSLPVGAIDTGLVLKVVEPIWSVKTETASRVRGRIEAVLDWAKARGLRDGENPARWRGHLDQLLPAKSQVAPVEHHPAMPYRELPKFIAELRAKEGASARALEFTILTAARTNDTIGGTLKEIDGKERFWTVPADRVKGKKGKRKRDHVVPLSDAAFELLPKTGNFLFPGPSGYAGLSNAAMSELLKGMGYAPDFATVHGFRSTFKDWCSEQTAYPNEMSELALAHTVSDKVEAAYRRGDMREKRRRMMADWAAFCTAPASKRDNVVPINAVAQ